MRRKLFTFLSAVSLVLCVATVALWVRSYRVMDALARPIEGDDGARVVLFSSHGRLAFLRRWSGWGRRPKHVGWRYYTGEPTDMSRWPIRPPPSLDFAGFLRAPHEWGGSDWGVLFVASVPHWFVVAATSAARVPNVVDRSPSPEGRHGADDIHHPVGPVAAVVRGDGLLRVAVPARDTQPNRSPEYLTGRD
jgi:hypothetical protein